MDYLKQLFDGSYIKRRFFGSVWAIVAATVVQEIICFANVAAGGITLGSEVLSAFGIVLPLISVQVALMRIFLDGLIILVPRSYGKGRRAHADRLFGSAVVAEALVLLITGLVTYCCRSFLLKLMSHGAACPVYAEAFYDWSLPVMAAGSVRLILERLAIVEGRMRLVYLGSGAFIVLDILGLVTLIKPFGVNGLCAAEMLSALGATLVVLVGFFLRKPSFHIRLALNFSDLHGLVAAGLPKVFGRIGDALVIFLLNAFVVRNFGMEWLACVHFVKKVRKFMTAFPDAFDNASTPIVCAQVGARNWRGVINTMRIACTVTPIAGLIVTLVMIFCAERLAVWCGFTGEGVGMAALSLRWGTVMITFFFLKDILCSYYVVRGRVALPSIVRVLSRGLLTYMIGVCCVQWFNGDGALFLRMIAVSDFCILAFLLVGGMMGRQDDESLILNIPLAELAHQKIFDVTIASASITVLRDRVAQWLRECGCSSRAVMRAQLLVEETISGLALHTKGRRHILQCVVSAPSGRHGGTIEFSDTLSLTDHTKPSAMPIEPTDEVSHRVIASLGGVRDYNPVLGSNRTIYTLVPSATLD